MSTQSCRMSRIPRIYPCKKVAKCEKRAILLGVKAYLGVNYLTFSEHNWGLKVDWNSDPPLSRFWSKPRSEEESKGIEFDQKLFPHNWTMHAFPPSVCDQPKPIKINQDLFSILNHSYIYLYFVAGCQSFVPEYVIKTIFVTISFSISLDLLRDGLKVVAKDVHHHVEGVEGEPGGEEDDADRYQQQVCSASPRQFSSKPNTRKG